MTAILRRALGLGIAILVTWGIVAASRATYTLESGRVAVLRLSWSGRPERIETCRRLSAEELEALPAHMRHEVECVGRPARYLVRALDGATVLMADTVTGGGVRSDRAIYMLREFSLVPGSHALVVEITRIDSVTTTPEPPGHDSAGTEELWRPGPADRERREQEEQRRQRQDRLPATLRWEWNAELIAGRVVLVTYDPRVRALVGQTAK